MILYAGISLGCVMLASYMGSMRWLKIKYEKPTTSKKLGLKILHISDFHSTSARKTNTRMWERLHNLEFDLVALTGDLLQRDISELEPLKPHLRRLTSRAPVYFVDGNHEKFIYRELFDKLAELGIVVLDNRRVRININGREIDIIGLADFNRLRRGGFAGLPELFAGENDKFLIVLCHQPQIIKYIADYLPDLLLSGHTHGGQIRFPFLPAIYAPGQGLLPKYDHGWYREKNTDVYISKGIGATYFNVRFFNRPEVAIIEI